MATSSGVYELNHECPPERLPIIYSRGKTRVHRFYFDSSTTVPLQCAALVFLDAYVDKMSFG